MNYPKISIVTPSFNQAEYLEQTILSVIDQNYPNLEYIIIDGGSADKSIEVIKKHENKLSYWISENDNGLYNALQKGFQKTTGEIMGWINSDDLLIRKSLFTLADIFTNNKKVDWIQGHPCVVDELGRIIYQRVQRSSKFPFYLKDYRKDGIFIQQESTFWRRNLWEESGGYISEKYKYAGDFELWMRFFENANQYITRALIGSFRKRKDQISEKYYSCYLNECDNIVNKYLERLPRNEIEILNRIKKSRNSGLPKWLSKRSNIMAKKYLDNNYLVEFNSQKENFS